MILSLEMSKFVPNCEYKDLDDLEKFATSIAYKMKKVDLSLLSEENGNTFCSSPEQLKEVTEMSNSI